MSVLNAFLRRQPATCELLAQHSGRTFHVCLKGRVFALTILHDGTLATADPQIVPDVVLRIDVQRLMASGWRPGKPWPDLPGVLHVTGDAAMAQTLSTWAKHWRPELDDLLSDWLGDVVAQRLVQNTRSLVQTALVVGQNLRANLVEYLAYEVRVITPAPVMRDQVDHQHSFAQRLSALDERVSALTKRLQRLEGSARTPGEHA